MGPADLGLLTRYADHVVSEPDLAARLEEQRPLRVKLGVDPTARHITLGWAVPLRKLRQFQDAGHTAVLIIGDFTARVGDPSGKSQTRPQLTKEEVDANAEACLAQLLDVLSEQNLEVRRNSEWLESLSLAGVLKLSASYTVAQMLERDDFAKRFNDNRPVSIIEFLYPLLQAYDSVAVQADVELGGTDQLFNLLVGRDIQRAFGQRPQVALTMPLLVGTDGVHKMSQSLDNYIGIREAANEMFGKLMRIPDHLVGQYAAVGAWLAPDEVERLSQTAQAGGPEAADAKRAVARAVVALYHGDAAAIDAEAAFDRVFREHRAPAEVQEAQLPREALAGGVAYLPALLAELGLAGSRSEARRLISQGGVRINGEPATEEEVPQDRIRGALIQVGRRRFVRVAS
jgi:tyrosyl-tRNA synthetase